LQAFRVSGFVLTKPELEKGITGSESVFGPESGGSSFCRSLASGIDPDFEEDR
jgi:hypothetical protein